MSSGKKRIVPLILAAVGALVLLGLLTAGTYAWFTSNRRVATDTSATVRAAEQNVTLGIATKVDSVYSDIADIDTIEFGDVLDPVSTSDLNTFFRNTNMIGQQAVAFEQTSEGYFHGRVYIMAQSQGMSENAFVNLYIDTAGISVNEPEDVAGMLINAARFGLIFTGSRENGTVIFNLNSDHNGGNDTYHNTTLDGVALTEDMVLTNVSGAPAYAVDPSVDPSVYMITESDGTITLPDTPIASINLNQPVMVDIYFYLEGCDSDCTNAIRTTEMSIQLPFYGILMEGGAQ